MLGLSVVASALLLVSGAAAQVDCSSLRGAIQTYSQQTATDGLDKSITTFNALLDVFGIDNAVIGQFGSSNALVPTDRAFANLVSSIGGPDVDPMAFVMSHPNTFKQIILYHFTGPMNGQSGDSHTALAAMDRLSSIIDVSAVCGREDSKFIKIQYKAGEQAGKFTLTEPVAKHYTANTMDSVCNTNTVTVTTIDEVLTPCPHAITFPANLDGEFGCMSVAKAASHIQGHPLGTLPYEQDASPVVANLKHPNLLASAGAQFTVFVPTADALQASGITSPDFVSIPGALDHVVKGHVAQREVCIGGQVPATPVATLADDQFCQSEGALTMVAAAPNSLRVVSDTGSEARTTPINNIAVCGGLVHVVDSVLLPCEVADYTLEPPASPASPESAAATGNTPSSSERSIDTPTVNDGTSGASGAATVLSGAVAAVATACALLL